MVSVCDWALCWAGCCAKSNVFLGRLALLLKSKTQTQREFGGLVRTNRSSHTLTLVDGGNKKSSRYTTSRRSLLTPLKVFGEAMLIFWGFPVPVKWDSMCRCTMLKQNCTKSRMRSELHLELKKLI